MHLPALIQDLAVILGVAALITFIFRRIRQPMALGYITAGIVVGPYTPAILSVSETDSIKVWAELGVIFLMFTLGLEFSFRRLARVGMSAGLTAIMEVSTMLLCGTFAAHLLGFSGMNALFLACMMAISSTTIIIKTFDELGLKTKKFAELVFGILIVEDLAAILILVALTNIATTSTVNGLELLFAAGKLALVVGAWFLAGMFLVPGFIHSVSRHGTDEMLTVLAIALCLGFVALASYFEYSAALGAFIIGSIIAENIEARRIEHLVTPLKDIFAAVFFVSVGMLLNPWTILANWHAVLLVSAIIICGKVCAVTLGSITTGQNLKNSLQIGFSMAQVGEFSFIIATLGQAHQVIDNRLYPIIVAASLITTFTTPYLVKIALPISERLEKTLPERILQTLATYDAWIQRKTFEVASHNSLSRPALKWGANAVIVTAAFTTIAEKVLPNASKYIDFISPEGVAWFLAFFISSPSLFAMLSAFRGGAMQIFSQMLTIALLGILAIEYFPAKIALSTVALGCGLVFIVFRRRIGNYYRWLEQQFTSGFEAELGSGEEKIATHTRLAPWDAHLVELEIPAESYLIGHPLVDLSLRERFGLNIVIIVRAGTNIVAPKASEVLYPGDHILCFATDTDIERFKSELFPQKARNDSPQDIEEYSLSLIQVSKSSQFIGSTIRKSGIREKFDCIVVGLERSQTRMPSPNSDLILESGDMLWIVGESAKLSRLEQEFRL